MATKISKKTNYRVSKTYAFFFISHSRTPLKFKHSLNVAAKVLPLVSLLATLYKWLYDAIYHAQSQIFVANSSNFVAASVAASMAS